MDDEIPRPLVGMKCECGLDAVEIHCPEIAQQARPVGAAESGEISNRQRQASSGRRGIGLDHRQEVNRPRAGIDLLDFAEGTRHRIVTREGRQFDGTWDEIVAEMRDASSEFSGRSVFDFMAAESRRQFRSTGVRIPARDAESFIRGSADAGLLRIVR